MKTGLRTLFAFLFMVLTGLPSMQAQMSRLYTSQQGLNTSACRGVTIDSRGFAWIAGERSIGIFGGRDFKYIPIKSEKSGRDLFQSSYKVVEFKDGQYFVCSSHGLFLLDSKKLKYSRINLSENEDSIYGCATNNIIDYIDTDCKLVTTDGFGMYVVDTKSMKVDERQTRSIVSAMKSMNFVQCPVIDKEHLLWFFDNQAGLSCINLNIMRQHKFEMTSGAAVMLQNCKVESIIEAEAKVIFGTTKGMLVYDRAENTVRDIPETHGMYITSLVYTKNDDLLIGTDSKGIWQMTREHSLSQINDPNANFEMGYVKVMDLEQDNEGNIVALLYEKGLAVIPYPSDCFHYHTISPSGNGKNATCITSMAFDKYENYWVGTDGCGVFTTDGMKLATARMVNDGLSSLLVQCVQIDKRGTVWAATYGGGVQYLEGQKWTYGGWLNELSGEFAMTLSYDSKNDKMYVGTNGNGVYVVDIESRKVEKLSKIGYNPWVSALLVDSKGSIWLGTSAMLEHINLKTGKRNEIKINGDRLSNASCIIQEGDNVYIGSDKGLAIYDLKTNKQISITKKDGLKNNNVKAITVTQHHVWVSTSTSIASIDRKTYAIQNYSSYGGYSVGEFHANSIVKPGHHYILFGGNDGIICFTPQLVASRTQKVEKLYFTDFVTAQNTEEMDANIFYAKKIKLSHDNNSFNISFTSPEFGDPYRIHYDYMLKGLENEWHIDSPTTTASYSSLSPGKYTFIVRAYLEDNHEESYEKELTIIVSSPWYASTWAMLCYAVIACVIVFYLNKLNLERKKEKEFIRRSEEVDRMKEAKLNLFTSITHELRSPLMMIESPLRQLITEDKNKDHQLLYSVMMRNCNRLLGIVKQITDIRKIDAGQFTLKLEEQNYVKYADEVFEQFKGVATVKNISFIVEHAEEELPMMLDTTHFEKIITNLLSNAFKFTPEGGKVIVRSGIVGSNVELRFYNSGSHINEDDMEHLWERFYQGNSKEANSGSGIGLNLVYELTKLHHGSISVTNIQPDGVEFTLHFPYFSSNPIVKDAVADIESHQKPTVLLVDDDSEIISYVRSQLENEFNIITAFSGKSGWKQVLTMRPDVVVTDYRMPDGNGVELSQLIKSNPETDNTPIIMLTGEGDEMLQLHSLNIQVDHYLEKPVNVMVLRSAISQVLRVRENLRNKVRRTELGTEMPKVTIENADDKLFARINEAIKKHIDDSEYSVMQLADDAGISRIHLNRKMKERYGVSPSVFLRSFRLKQAASLLINNDVNVSEVAYRVGFSSHSYFTVSFHDYFGMSPKEFVVFYSNEENSDALQKLLE